MKQLTNEQLLEHCLQEVARTGDIEAVLRRYPQYASQLRPLLEMAMTVGCYYAIVPEPPSGLETGRARLIATAAQQRARGQAITIRKERKQPKMKLFLVTRLVSAILAVVIGTAAVGGGVVWAASDSLPGDFIYAVKLTVENLRMDLARTPEAQVDLALQFAEERVAEIQAMVETELPVSEQVTTRMEQHFQHALHQAAWAPENEMPGLLAQIAQRAQTQAQVLEQVRAMAPEEAQEGLKLAQQICQREHEAAMAALGDPQTFRFRNQQREGMPDEVEPPTPPTIVPPGGQEGRQGTGWPDQTRSLHLRATKSAIGSGTKTASSRGSTPSSRNNSRINSASSSRINSASSRSSSPSSRINSRINSASSSRSSSPSSRNNSRINSASSSRSSNRNKNSSASRSRNSNRISSASSPQLRIVEVEAEKKSRASNRDHS